MHGIGLLDLQEHYNTLSVVIKLTTNIPYMWSNYARIMAVDSCVEQQLHVCFPGNFCAKQTDWSDSLSGQNPIQMLVPIPSSSLRERDNRLYVFISDRAAVRLNGGFAGVVQARGRR